MGIDISEESKLQFYFQADRLFWRSTFGVQLERAAAAYGRSELTRADSGPTSWHWNPPDARTKEQGTPAMHIASALSQQTPSGNEVEGDDLMRHAEVSRRLRRLWAAGAPGPDCDPAARESYIVLALYYGDRGASWAAAASDRHEDETRKRVTFIGHGPGAIAGLFRVTVAGQELLRRERLASIEAATSTGLPTAAATAIRLARKAELAEAIEVHEEKARLAGWSAEAANKEIAEWTVDLQAHRAAKLPGLRALYTRIERARRRVEGLLSTQTGHERAVELLRSARSVDTAGLAANPVPDPEAAPALAALATWREACASLTTERAEKGLPTRAEDLPPCPAQIPAARLPTLHEPASAVILDDDTQLEVAMLLQRRKHSDARRLLLERANRQAEALLQRAWAYWASTAPSQPRRERLPQRPGTIRAYRAVERQPVTPITDSPSTLAEEPPCPA